MDGEGFVGCFAHGASTDVLANLETFENMVRLESVFLCVCVLVSFVRSCVYVYLCVFLCVYVCVCEVIRAYELVVLTLVPYEQRTQNVQQQSKKVVARCLA